MMPDKEQELLEEVRIAYEALEDTIKAIGYVRWDREKVAEMFCGIDWNTGSWETRTDYGKERYYKQADQLKEILTGGDGV